MIDSCCENLCANNSGAGLGCLPTAYYGSAPDDVAKQSLISQQCLRSKIMGLWINNYLTTDVNCKLIAFGTSYTFNNQDEESSMLFVRVKMVHPDTRSGFSYIKTKLQTMKMSHFKHDISKANIQEA